MLLAFLALSYCSFFGVAAAIIAVARREFKKYEAWAAPLNFGIASMLFENALNGNVPFHALFLVSSYVIAAGGMLVLGKMMQRRPLNATDVWVLFAAAGALCPITYTHVPPVATDGLALLCALGGTLCFTWWFKHLPSASITQSL